MLHNLVIATFLLEEMAGELSLSFIRILMVALLTVLSFILAQKLCQDGQLVRKVIGMDGYNF